MEPNFEYGTLRYVKRSTNIYLNLKNALIMYFLFLSLFYIITCCSDMLKEYC